MKTVFLDTNVVLDLLLNNRPGRSHAEQIFSLGVFGDVQLVVSSITFANSAYFLEKKFPPQEARIKLKLLRSLVFVSSDSHTTVDNALGLDEWDDFEDALQYSSAIASDADLILTRDAVGFANSAIQVQSPAEFLELRS